MPRRRKRNLKPVEHNFNRREVLERIEAHFSKLFTFIKPESNEMQWILPNAEDLFKSNAWCDENMMNLKKELNSIKDRLSDKNINLWRQHTQEVNIVGKVVPYVRSKIKAEFCTQAWCKFYEILCTFPLFLRNSSMKSLNSVHLCEAPGAFVTALNHYLALNYPHLELSWLATTLNPYYEGNELGVTIPDDRFILPTIEHWDFGIDNTGDLFCHQNRLALLKKIKSTGPVHLITADGSVDCQDNPSEQESSVAMLHLLELTTALQILAPLGNLVIKLFTCFEYTSICLLYLLNCTFKQVYIFKPGTSKRGNSEVYVVGLEYFGENEIHNHLKVIEANLRQASSSTAMFGYNHLPNNFLEQMIACCTYFKNLQAEAILEHLSWFEHISDAQRRLLERSKILAVQTFVKKYAIVPIPYEARVVKNKKLTSHHTQNKPLKEGSLAERSKAALLSSQQKVNELELSLRNIMAELKIVVKDSFYTNLPVYNLPQQVELNISFGKEYNRCSNSHFCNLSVLKCWNQVDGMIRNLDYEMIQDTRFDHSELADIILHHLAEFSSDCCEFLAQHPSCEPLADCLKKACISKEVSSQTATKVHLSDLRYLPHSWMPLYSARNIVKCLENFLSAFELLRTRDRMIFLVDTLLTRVEVGLLYALHQTFEKVILLSVSTCTFLPMELILCFNYTRPILTSNVMKLKSAIQLKTDDAILELVPISDLFDEPFFSTIFSFNCYALSQRMQKLISHMKCLMPVNK